MDYRELPKISKCEPSAVQVEAGKTYSWCTCGLTQKAPLCDGSHKTCWTHDENGELQMHFRSLKFTAEKTEEVWLCNCKRTHTPPFCDDTHLSIQPCQPWNGGKRDDAA